MSASSGHSPLEKTIANIENQISQTVTQDGLGSIVAGIVLGSELVWAKAFGWADIERQIPATTDTIYRAGSITKTFTAVLMMQLVERAMFSLDDRVENYFPEIKKLVGYTRHAPLTFRQLASHTAGLNQEPALPNAAQGSFEEWEAKILVAIPTTSFKYRPGERFLYSNIGIGILGLALSRIAQKSYIDLVQELIFDPLEMKQSCFILPAAFQSALATGYDNYADGTVNQELPRQEHSGRGYKVPNGGSYSNIGNLARYAAAHIGTAPAQILSAQSRAEMRKIQAMDTKRIGYGLGLRVDIGPNGYRTFRHGGAVAGYQAGLAFDPKLKIAVVMLRNYSIGKRVTGMYVRHLLRELIAASGR